MLVKERDELRECLGDIEYMIRRWGGARKEVKDYVRERIVQMQRRIED